MNSEHKLKGEYPLCLHQNIEGINVWLALIVSSHNT